MKPDLTREPKPPPFAVGTQVRYLGRDHIKTAYNAADTGTLVKYHGMVVTIVRVVEGRRGTARQLRDEDGPMFYDDDEREPILDTTKDGYSVYEVVDHKGRKHGRAIQHDALSEWEVVK